LVAVYLVGGPSGLLLGRGEGELAAGALLGVSLLLAAVRGDAGCKLTSIPAALFGKRSLLACMYSHRLTGSSESCGGTRKT